MDEKYVKVDDIVEYCNTYSFYLQGKGQGVAQCALRYVKEFAKENATDVQPVNQWISVKDRLPNEDDCYLVVIESETCVSIDIAEYSENRWHKHDKVLYWQPLPEPPKDGDAE